MSLASDEKKHSQEAAAAASASVSNNGSVEEELKRPDTLLEGKKLALVFVALLLAMLLIALDQTILSTALPRISSQFNNFSLQGWVATSFVLAQSVFLPLYGQALRIFPSKWTLVSAMIIFEVGSLVCALSQDIYTLIAGRAVSGVGAAGLYVPVLQIISEIAPMEKRPQLFGMLGAVFGLSSIIGPLIGGAFTDHVSWRWCFWINLPVGGVSIAAVILTLKAAPPIGCDLSKRTNKDIINQALNMDFIGTVLFAGAVTCLVLSLQWGGNTKEWGDAAVIVCFVMAAVLAVATVLWEKWIGENKAMLPLRIFKSLSVYSIMFYCFFNRFALLLFSFYIPIFYQAARNRTAVDSGIDLLPFLLAAVLSTIISGVLIGRIGRYWPFVVAAPIPLAIGSGLMYTLKTDTSMSNIIGYQILLGLGVGLGMQNVILAIQVEFKEEPKLLSQSTSMASVAQTIGGTIGLGIAEPVFATQLRKNLLKFAQDAPQEIVRESPTSIYTKLSGDLVGRVVHAYTESLRMVFIIGVPIAGLSLIAALFIKNLKVVKAAPAPAAVEEKPVEVERTRSDQTAV